MRISRVMLLVLALVWPMGTAHASDSSFEAVSRAISNGENFEEPKICTDDDGVVQRSVDLLLLLDNSTSLNRAEVPSDEKRIRFEAIKNMLEVIGSAVDNADVPFEVRFGALTFSARAQELIPLAENLVTGATAAKLANKIDQDLPNDSQTGGTNYLNAIERAFKVFGESSTSNRCRVLVWLTDGEFSHGGSQKQTDDALKDLFGEMCKKGGFADRARDPKTQIWPFVVLLKSPDGQSTDPRRANIIRESYDLMRRLTGAPYEFAGHPSAAKCPDKDLGGQIGSIYTADQAESLGPVFEKLGLTIGGAQLIDACPIKVTAKVTEVGYLSIDLPAPRFLSEIAMVSAGRVPLPKANQITLVTSGGKEIGLSAHFGYQQKSETLLYLDAIKGSKLESGWKLKVVDSNLEGFCLLAKTIGGVSVKVERQGAQMPVLSWEDGGKNLTSDDLERIEFLLDKQPIDRAALSQVSESDAQRLSARLSVDPSGKLLPDGLPIKIIGFSALPDFDPQGCIELLIPRGGVSGRGDTPQTKEFESTSCNVDLRNIVTEILIDTSRAEVNLRTIKGCESVSLVSVVDGEEKSGFAGNAIFKVGLLLRFTSDSLSCSNSISSQGEASVDAISIPLELKFSLKTGDLNRVETKEIAVKVDIDVKMKPITWLVWVITGLLILLGVLLSFGLLWLMNLLVIRLPEPSKFLALKLPLTISSRDPLRPEFQLGDLTLGKLTLDVGKFEGIRGDRQKWLAANGLALRRKLANPLLRPLDEPRAVFVSSSSSTVVAYGPLFNPKGLGLPFRRALVLVLNRPESDTAPITGQVFALVSSDPRDGGFEAVSQLTDPSVLSQLIRALLKSSLLEVMAEKVPPTDPPSSKTQPILGVKGREPKANRPRVPRGKTGTN